MSLNVFWFAAAVSIVILDLYFTNAPLLVVAVGCFITGIFSFFFASVYLQISVLFLCLLVMFWIHVSWHRQSLSETLDSKYLTRYIGKTVIVHEWKDNRCAEVQFDGKLWDAEIAFSADKKPQLGSYQIWKVLPKKLILTRDS